MKTIYNFLKNNQQVYIRFSARNGILSFLESKSKDTDICVQTKSDFLPVYRNILEKYIEKVKQDIYVVVYIGNKAGDSEDKKANTIQFYKEWDICCAETEGREHFMRKCKMDDIPGYLSEFMAKDFSATKFEKNWFFAGRRKEKSVESDSKTDSVPEAGQASDGFIVIHTGLKENLTILDITKFVNKSAEPNKQFSITEYASQDRKQSCRGKRLVVNMNEPPKPEEKPEPVLTAEQKAAKAYCEAHGVDYDMLPPWMDAMEFVASKQKEPVIAPVKTEEEKIKVQIALTPEILKIILANYDVELLQESPVEEAEAFFDQQEAESFFDRL